MKCEKKNYFFDDFLSAGIPGQASKRNMKEKYSFGDFLSADFWQKLWEWNKIAMKKFLKNLLFGVDVKQ